MQFTEVTFTLPRLATHLGINEDALREIFRDGRTAAAFAPQWIKRAFEMEDNGLDNTFVRVLTREVNFMPSRTRGVGRSGTVDDLLEHLKSFLWIAVVDVAEFPKVGFYLFTPNRVRQWVEEEGLGIGGMSRADWLKRTFLDRQRAGV